MGTANETPESIVICSTVNVWNPEERRARFKREAKAPAALDHPNIVQVFSVEEAAGVHFITMQLVQGKTLTEVLDFGLAKPTRGFVGGDADSALPTAAKTAEGVIVGTVNYMSPEQAQGKTVDARSDIFSLGIIFYEMATGERPFKGTRPHRCCLRF